MANCAVRACNAVESMACVVVFDRLRVSLMMPASMMRAVSSSMAMPCSLYIS